MSNERMDVPSNPYEGWDRIELVAYLDKQLVAEEPDIVQFFGDVLHHYAKIPFILEDEHLAPEKVVPVFVLGQGRVAFYGDPSIAAFILIPPPLEFPESRLHEHLKLDGDRVDLLALVPITHEEVAYIEAWGVDRFLAVAKLSVIYAGPRASAVSNVVIPAPNAEASDGAAKPAETKPAAKPWWQLW